MVRLFGLAASLSGFLSVAFGAFGAHFLKRHLDEYSLSVFRTGVEYQFFHALALGWIMLLLMKVDNGAVRAAGISFIVGTILFSGSLYLF